MPYMTQMCINLLNSPHTHPISIHTPPRQEERSRGPRTTSTRDTPEPPASRPRDHPAPPRPATPTQERTHIHVDAPDLGNPPRQTPLDPKHPPLTPTTISDPKLLHAALQGRAVDTPLGWYRLQESWTALTVKALRDLTTPGKGLHETIVDLVLWRGRR